MSPTEREALTVVGKKFGFALGGDVAKVTVSKPIDKVELAISKAMKRGRKLLSAVVFKNGRVEELHRGETPYRDQPEKEKEGAEKPAAAVTVAAPMLGCPVPEFERADVRATRVLRAFLTPAQLADFERTQHAP